MTVSYKTCTIIFSLKYILNELTLRIKEQVVWRCFTIGRGACRLATFLKRDAVIVTGLWTLETFAKHLWEAVSEILKEWVGIYSLFCEMCFQLVFAPAKALRNKFCPLIFKGVFLTLLNIYVGDFCKKQLETVHYMYKAPSWIINKFYICLWTISVLLFESLDDWLFCEA